MNFKDRVVKAVFNNAEDVECAFYEAFGSGNFKLMESLFADSNVSCTHPGASTLVGRDKVIIYWKYILDGIPMALINWEILCSTRHENVEVHQVLESYVIDEHTREKSEVYTTNVFVLQDDGWRLQMQHSSLPETKKQSSPKLSKIIYNNLSDSRVLN